MKFSIIIICLLFSTLASAQQQGYLQTVFDKNAVICTEENAYLLGYLSYLAYPKYLYHYQKRQEPNLPISQWTKMDSEKDYYLAQFRKSTQTFFGELPAENYAFFSVLHKKYDPEVLLVEDTACIWLIFRGTDSVMTEKKPFLKEYQEWISTDFDLRKQHLRKVSKGMIHSGFSKSLSLIADSLGKEVLKRGGKHKKVWLCGHSLGGGQALLFAMYLHKNYRIKAQGVYVYACPPVGNSVFEREINSIFSRNQIQRFDFVEDPVTLLPPHIFGFRHVGTRNYFASTHEVAYKVAERKAIVGNLRIWAFPFNLGSVLLKQTLRKPAMKLPLGGLCFHHPEWYLQALYRPDAAQKLPDLLPMPLPTAENMGCDCQKVARGKNENLIYQAQK